MVGTPEPKAATHGCGRRIAVVRATQTPNDQSQRHCSGPKRARTNSATFQPSVQQGQFGVPAGANPTNRGVLSLSYPGGTTGGPAGYVTTTYFCSGSRAALTATSAQRRLTPRFRTESLHRRSLPGGAKVVIQAQDCRTSGVGGRVLSCGRAPRDRRGSTKTRRTNSGILICIMNNPPITWQPVPATH